jgi:N-acetylglucosamine malate deacetylase 1
MGIDLLAFGAHPDDVELGCGGTLIAAARRGRSTGVVTLTRGESGTRGSVEERAAEFEASCAVMGCAHRQMLDLPDGGLTVDEPSRRTVVRVLRALRPRVVLLPHWEDRHPDHGNASRIVQEAAFLAGLRRLDTGQEPHRPAELLYYMASWEFEPSFVIDVSAVMEEKMKAIRCYASQVWNGDGQDGTEGPGREEGTLISSRGYWELLMARAAHYGRLIGCGYGEPFKVRRLIEIKDPLEAFGGRTW